MTNRFISVNLLLYKPGIYLKPCLESILAQSYKNFELLIIDNASNDETVGQVKKILEILPVTIKWRLIINEKNLGFAAGHNLGIKESSGELVALVNQDVILDGKFLENIVGIFEQDKKIGSAQGKLLRIKINEDKLEKSEVVDNAGLVILKNRRIIARGQGQKDSEEFNKKEEIFGVDGALPVYRREALEDIKINLDGKTEYFDEDFFAYKEDVDLAWRLRLYGWQARYEPKALAWHARTAGDSAKTSYIGIIKERLKINQFGKYHAFKNQRLMQIKNEQIGLLVRHSLWFLPKEFSAWLYVLVFEHYTWKSIKELFKLTPRAWQKRKIIMARKKVSDKEMKKWFQ